MMVGGEAGGGDGAGGDRRCGMSGSAVVLWLNYGGDDTSQKVDS